ncbi:MAG: hypothetical protein QM529_00370 [Hydrotalea sp.]|nr:hypothetical protein [Hydrotalea sp.]
MTYALPLPLSSFNNLEKSATPLNLFNGLKQSERFNYISRQSGRQMSIIKSILNIDDNNSYYNANIKFEIEKKIAQAIQRTREEDEKIRPNATSQTNLLAFLSTGNFDLPSVFLLENGVFQIVWSKGAGERIEVQFLEDGFIELAAIIKEGNKNVPRYFVYQEKENVIRQIKNDRLDRIINEKKHT